MIRRTLLSPSKPMKYLTSSLLVSSAIATLGLSAQVGSKDRASTSTWFDADGDQLLDLLVHGSDKELQLLLNRGEGSFHDGTDEAALGGIRGVTQAHVADYDGDSLADLLLVAPSHRTLLRRGTPRGTFVAATEATGLPLGQSVESAQWRDFDGDGWLDLELRTSVSDRLFRNLAGQRFVEVDLGLVMEPQPLPANPGRAVTAPQQESDHIAPPQQTEAPLQRRSVGGAGSRTPVPTRATKGKAASGGSGLSNAPAIADQASPGTAIGASSVPQLGQLYPLTDRWFVDASTGNVGVGTTTPGRQLDVAGTIRARSGGIQFPDGTLQTTALTPGPSNAVWATHPGGVSHSGGNVGVGTASPTALLHVYGELASVGRGAATSGYEAELRMGGARDTAASFASLIYQNVDSQGSDAIYEAAEIRARRGSSADTSLLQFRTNDGGGTSNAMVIDEFGKTSLRGNMSLERDGLTSVRRTLTLSGNRSTSADPFATLSFSNPRPQNVHEAEVRARRTVTNGSELSFWTQNGSGQLRETMEITAAGAVGIRTAPAAPLDVAGVILAEGGYIFPDFTIQVDPLFAGTQVTSLGIGDFVSVGNTVTSNDRLSGVHNPGLSFIAGLDLPDGATIEKVTARVNETLGTSFTIEIGRSHLDQPGSTTVATLNVGGTANGGQTANTTLQHVVDYDLGRYFVHVTATQSNPMAVFEMIRIEWVQP